MLDLFPLPHVSNAERISKTDRNLLMGDLLYIPVQLADSQTAVRREREIERERDICKTEREV